MYRYLLGSLTLLACTAQAELLLDLDFETDSPGTPPAAYDGLRPLGGNTGETTPLPITAGEDGPMGVIVAPYTSAPIVNAVGSGQFLRYYDYHTSNAPGWEKNFVAGSAAGRDAIRFSFDFATIASGIDSNDQLRVSVGQYFDQDKINLGSSARRPFLFDLRNNGSYNLSLATTTDSASGTFDTSTAHHVDLYVNDAQETTHAITGPDAQERDLPPNTVTLFFDNVFIAQGTLDNTLNYLLTGQNLGRIGFFSTTANANIDFLLDNVQVEGIDSPSNGGNGGDTDAWKSEGTEIFNEDFEAYSAGAAPNGERVRPNANVGMTDAYPLSESADGPIGLATEPVSGSPVTNSVGSSKFLRLYDSDTNDGVSWEKNFVAGEADQISTFRASFKIASSAASLTAGAQLRMSLGNFSDSASSILGASSGRPFLLYFTNDGGVTLDMQETENDASTSISKDAEHQVVIYINDEQARSHSVTGPDGETHTLYTNSVTLFVDGALVGVEPLDFELNFNLTEDNFGRLGFFTLSSQAGADFIVDDLVVAELDNPDSVLVPWPGNGGTGGANEGDPPADNSEDYDLIFLDETFDYVDGELGAVSFFTVADGNPLLTVENSALTYDYAAANAGELSGHYKNTFYGGNLVQTDTRADNAYGPGVYVRFRPRFVTAPDSAATGGVPFLALNNPDLPAYVNGRVWVRAGATADTFQLGISPDGQAANVAWADALFGVGDAPLVVLKYNNETNDSRLWIDPATGSETPDAYAFIRDDFGYYGVNAISAMINNTADLGEFTIDDLRVCGSFADALDFTPVERPEVLLTGSNGIYAAESRAYRTSISGNMELGSLLVGGEAFLAEGTGGGAGWEAPSTGTIGNSRQYGSAHLHIQTNWQLATASFDAKRITLNLQNNDEDNAVAYRFAFDPSLLTEVVLADGTSLSLPLTSTATSEAITLRSTYNTLRLTGVSEAYMDNGTLVVDADLAPRETRPVTLFFGSHQLASPQNWQVFQRTSEEEGPFHLRGRVFDDVDSVVVTLSGGTPIAGSLPTAQTATVDSATGAFDTTFSVPAGGWYTAQVSYRQSGTEVGSDTIAHVGVGEVFIGAGQSNSTNSGPEQTQPTSDLVVAYSGGHWQPGLDPQPGNHDSSSGGSYYPSLGDQLAAEYAVPVAIASTGMGASAIRFWQPDYAYDYADYVSYARHNGLYRWTLNRVQELGENGFRAILWHQGESDSSHDVGVTRTTEEEYYNGLKNLILSMRADAGWDIPWYVARASVWPLPGENPNGDPNIYTAQMRIWEDGIAFEGANTDSLGLEYRQPDGSRVHFTPTGLAAHAALWFDILKEDLDALFAGTGDPLAQSVAQGFGSASQDLGNGYFQTPGFGEIFATGFPWFHNPDFGWCYLHASANPASAMFLYSIGALGDGSWLFTRTDLLPFLYSYGEGGWLYLIRSNGSDPAIVYHYNSGEFEELP